MTTTEPRELAYQLVVSSARLVRLAARDSTSSVPRALARALAVINDLDEPRISDIAAHDRVSQPTATTLVQKLEERGWVTRTPDPADARAVRIRITEPGRKAMAEVRASAADALAPRLAALSADQLESLVRATEVVATLLEHQDHQEETA